MSRFYVANATKQYVDFAYRLPERSGAIVQRIPIGGQIQLSGELSSIDIDAVLSQWRRYGLIPVAEIDNSKTDFVGLCYSIDKQISVDKLMRAMERNEDSLEEKGRAMRKEAAVAVNNQIESDTGAPLRNLDLSVRELEPSGGFKDEGVSHVDESIRVTREGSDSDLPRVPPGATRRRK